MKKIIVAGGVGFIGVHLCKKLLENKNNLVICLDNFYSGQKKNLELFKNKKNFKFIKHDINKKISIPADEIYNLACPASPKFYQEDPVYTIKTCIIGTSNLLDNALKFNAKFFQASTSEIYGDPIYHPQHEKDWGNVNPIGVRSCYDEGKRGAETLCFDFNRQFNLSVKVARIFNTYGPHMYKYDGRVISNIILQALKNKEINIYGNGKQTRSFCYVDDLILGITKFMRTKKSFLGPVNLGNPNETSILSIANKIKKLTKSKSKIVFKKLPKDDPTRRKPDINKAKKQLKWHPKVHIDEGLIKTIKYYYKLS
jgi:UDP-glucuronate decarboxylase